MRVRNLAVAFLLLEALGAVIWWTCLLLRPDLRAAFLAPGAPDSVLVAFLPPDLFLFVGGALGAAYGIRANRFWAWSAVCVHSGAAVYAALYALALFVLTGGGYWGALLMAPTLVCLPLITWHLRPGSSTC